MDPLSELAVKYGSDKWSAKHSYTAWYYAQFAARRETVRKVVEIGVGEGASLRMWREFFPNAQIFGLEIDPKRCFIEERIEVLPCDQLSKADMDECLWLIGSDTADLFIDDGQHDFASQSMTALIALPKLPMDIVYVIEDVANPDHIEQVLGQMFQIEQPALEHRNRYDNRLLVIHA